MLFMSIIIGLYLMIAVSTVYHTKQEKWDEE